MYHSRRKIIYHVTRKKENGMREKQKKGIPLSTAIDGFMINCQARRLSPSTQDDYRRTLIKFLKHAGDQPIEQITSMQISAFLGAQTVGKKTVSNYHIGLSALWTWALKEEFVTKHVVRMVDKPEPDQFVVQPFTEVEIRALLEAVYYSPARNRALILLLLDTGARASEICNLKREDVDLVARHIKVMGKGGKERLIPFSPRTGSALFEHLSTNKGDPFEIKRTGLTQYFRRLGNRAGVNDVYPHRFRHTFAIMYLRNGGDPYTLQDILGHSTMDMVRRYLHIAHVDLQQAHRRASPVENLKL